MVDRAMSQLSGWRFCSDMLERARDFLAQIDDVEGFADEVKSAAVQCFSSELLRVDSGQYDHGTPGVNSLYALKRDQTVGFRHNHIQQHDVGPGILNLCQSQFNGVGFDQPKIFPQNHLQ